jgi:hypothetical protein
MDEQQEAAAAMMQQQRQLQQLQQLAAAQAAQQQAAAKQTAQTPSGEVIEIDDWLVEFANLFREMSGIDADRWAGWQRVGCLVVGGGGLWGWGGGAAGAACQGAGTCDCLATTHQHKV